MQAFVVLDILVRDQCHPLMQRSCAHKLTRPSGSLTTGSMPSTLRVDDVSLGAKVGDTNRICSHEPQNK